MKLTLVTSLKALTLHNNEIAIKQCVTCSRNLLLLTRMRGKLQMKCCMLPLEFGVHKHCHVRIAAPFRQL